MFVEFFQNIADKFGLSGLSTRERILVGLAGGVLVCLGLYHFLLAPYLEGRKNLESVIARKTSELSQVTLLKKKLVRLQRREGGIQEKLQERDPNFSLFTFLDTQAKNAGIKGLIQYMKPSIVEKEDGMDKAVVEMKLRQIGLSSLVSYLQLIESEKNVVVVKRMSIQKNNKSADYLDVILQVITFVGESQQ